MAKGFGYFKKSDGTYPDPPHWITGTTSIVAVVALALTIRSLSVAQNSLKIGEQNMKVGQRAYLVIQNGKTTLEDVFPLPNLSEHADKAFRADMENVRYSMVRTSLGFEISNLGSTPASNVAVALAFELPSGWGFYPRIQRDSYRMDLGRNVISINGIGDIAQRTATAQSFTEIIDLSDSAKETYQKHVSDSYGAPPKGFTVKGTLTYNDVFGDAHSAQWEWEVHEPSGYDKLFSKLTAAAEKAAAENKP